jgi:Plant transposon protein
VFGVLFKRFAILYKPSRLWTTSAMSDIVDCCVVLHNMIVRVRKRNYTGTANLRLVEDGALPLSVSRIFQNGDRVEEHGEFWRATVANVDNSNHHHQLKAALVRYIWDKAGSDALLDSRSDGDSFATSTVVKDASSVIQCDQNEGLDHSILKYKVIMLV